MLVCGAIASRPSESCLAVINSLVRDLIVYFVLYSFNLNLPLKLCMVKFDAGIYSMLRLARQRARQLRE